MSKRKNRKLKKNQTTSISGSIVNPQAEDRIARRLGLNVNRDIFKDCNIEPPEIEDLQSVYEYHPIAGRIGDAFPEAIWSSDIKITDNLESDEESPFDKSVNQFIQEYNLWDLMERADKALAYGRFSIIRFGIQDGLDADLPAGTHNKKYKAYFTVHPETSSGFVEMDHNTSSPRFGYPEMYQLRIGGDYVQGAHSYGLASATIPTSNIKVHHSRCVMLTDELVGSSILGRPRLQRLYYDLKNLIKVSFSAAESWYQRTRNPYVLSIKDDTGKINDDLLAEFDEYWAEIVDEGFSRAITVKNAEVSTVQASVDDPSRHVETIIKKLSGGSRIPMSMLVGVDKGMHVLSHDANSWAGAVHDHRTTKSAKQLREVIDKAIELKMIIPPKNNEYHIDWPNIVIENAKDKADTAAKISNAVRNMVGKNENIDMLLTRKQRVEDVLGMDFLEDEVEDEMPMPEDTPLSPTQKANWGIPQTEEIDDEIPLPRIKEEDEPGNSQGS